MMNSGNNPRGNYQNDQSDKSQLNTLNGDYHASLANNSPDVIRNAKGLANIS